MAAALAKWLSFAEASCSAIGAMVSRFVQQSVMRQSGWKREVRNPNSSLVPIIVKVLWPEDIQVLRLRGNISPAPIGNAFDTNSDSASQPLALPPMPRILIQRSIGEWRRDLIDRPALIDVWERGSHR
jgi:hypothetical protein